MSARARALLRRRRDDEREGDPARVALLAIGAGTVVLAALSLWRPGIGFDGLGYHLPLPAAWLPQGALGGRPMVIETLPIEAYPVGFELASAWTIVVTGATSMGMLVPPLALGVLALGTWRLARGLGAGVAAAWGATATVVLALPTLIQGAQSASDMPAAALLAAGAALAVDGASRADADGPGDATTAGDDRVVGDPGPHDVADRRPEALATSGVLVGTVAILLGVGTKTHAACGGLVALVLLVRHRRFVLAELRARPAWGAALGFAVVAGGVWLARNAILHGSPSWPLTSTSFGDPVPPVARPYVATFLSHPGRMLEIAGDRYARQVWTLPFLLLAGLVVAVRRPGPPRLVAVTGLLGVAAWTVAPATGITALAGTRAPDFSASAVRYLGPAIVLLAAAGWTLVPCGRDGEGAWVRRGLVASVVLVQGVLLVLGARRWLPHATDGIATEQGIAAAAATLVVAAIATRRPRWVVVPRPPAVAGAAIVCALLLVASVPGFWSRHAIVARTGVPPAATRTVLALGAVPAWSLGTSGKPGARVVGGCDALRAGYAAGHVVTIPAPLAAGVRCGLPGVPRTVDAFEVWTPTSG